MIVVSSFFLACINKLKNLKGISNANNSIILQRALMYVLHSYSNENVSIPVNICFRSVISSHVKKVMTLCREFNWKLGVKIVIVLCASVYQFVVEVIIPSQNGGPRGCAGRRQLLDGNGEVQMHSSSQSQQKNRLTRPQVKVANSCP